MHVHIHAPAGEAKFWLEPEIVLARNYGLSDHELTRIRRIIEAHENELRNAWRTFFWNSYGVGFKTDSKTSLVSKVTSLKKVVYWKLSLRSTGEYILSFDD